MPNPHPVELRRRVVHAYETGEGSYATIGERFAIGEASVKRWVWRYRDEGSVEPRPKGGGKYSQIAKREIVAIVARLPDANAGEITAEYNRRRRGHARVHVSSVKRALHRFGYVVKKSGYGRSSS